MLSYLIRFVPALFARREPSELARRAGGLVAPVAFAVLGTTAFAHVVAAPSVGLPWIAAAAGATFLTAAIRGGLAIPILAGMAVVWLGQLMA